MVVFSIAAKRLVHTPKREELRISLTLSDCGLQFPSTTQEANLLPQPDVSIVLRPHPDQPASALPVLRVFPQWLHAGAEDVDAVAVPDLGPRQIVEDAVEGTYVGDVLDQRGQQVLVLGVGLGVPHGPPVLERERAQLGDDHLVQGRRATR